jgi:protein-L-isoaspartate(D-aspartate) O-methyltransferase
MDSETGSNSRIEERENMVKYSIETRGISDPDVLAAMRAVPRHQFVPDTYQGLAYADQPLPIGYGQTISQPYIVALMTEALELSENQKVLEIGTGSGYQAAILAEMGMDVYSIEIIPELEASSKALIRSLDYDNIQTRNADGYFGWDEEAPFDAVIVTAAPDHLPQPLIQQLADGGRMVVPIGPTGAVQTLWLFTKEGEDLIAINLGAVSFVPLTGER